MSFGTAAPSDEAPVVVADPAIAPAPAVQTLDNGSIVVDGKIYTAEAAAKKIANADPHIATIEAENAEKDELINKLLTQFEALKNKVDHQGDIQDLVGQLQSAQAPEPAPTQEISMENLVEATVDSIKQKEVSIKQDTNLQASIAAAQELYGEHFGNEVDKLGESLGMSTR